MKNGSKLLHYQSKGNWSDNFNNYGKFKCKGSLLINESGKRGDKELVLCELEDVNGEYMWNIPKRSDSEWEAGVGKSKYILMEQIFLNWKIYDLRHFAQKCRSSSRTLTALLIQDSL